MKEKTKLRIIQILCIISLLITVFSIQRTYAKYFEKVDTKYDTDIKKWAINVNEKYIHEETTLSNVMTPKFFYDPNMNVNGGLNNILVPGRVGYFDFLIDYTNVDVAFKFAFTDIQQLNQKEVVTETTDEETGEIIEETTLVDNYLSDFEVYGYIVVDADLEITSTTKVTDIGEITTLSKDENGVYQLSDITQYINPVTDNEKQKRILVLFRWNDGDGSTMDNAADTAYEGEANTDENDTAHDLLKYNVKITFTQKI